MDQPSLFDPSDHARMSDPVSSHHTVHSIVHEPITTGYAADILAVMRDGGMWCDTGLWVSLEQRTGRRLQRNVIARARGRLVRDGLVEFVALDTCNHNQEPRMHFKLARGS